MSRIAVRTPIVYAMKVTLETVTSKAVSIGRGPYDPVSGDPMNTPYIVLNPRGKGYFWGSIDSPFECLRQFIQIKTVADRDDQALFLADRIRKILLDRNTDGSFVNPLNMIDEFGNPLQTVMDIAPAINSPGDLVPRANHWEVDDVLAISVTAAHS